MTFEEKRQSLIRLMIKNGATQNFVNSNVNLIKCLTSIEQGYDILTMLLFKLESKKEAQELEKAFNQVAIVLRELLCLRKHLYSEDSKREMLRGNLEYELSSEQVMI